MVQYEIPVVNRVMAMSDILCCESFNNSTYKIVIFKLEQMREFLVSLTGLEKKMWEHRQKIYRTF